MLILTVIIIFSKGFILNVEAKETITKHRLVTGVIFIWGALGTDGKWHWSPMEPGSSYLRNTAIKLPLGSKNIEFIPYSIRETDFSKFENLEAPGINLADYHEDYGRYAASDISGKIDTETDQRGYASYHYRCRLNPQSILFDATESLKTSDGVAEIRQLIGKGSPELDKYLKEQKIGKNVKAYMYFMPYIIKYKIDKVKDKEDDEEPIKVIEGKADLRLPKYTYIGQETKAEDNSIFNIDGENFGARLFYELGYGNSEITPEEGGQITYAEKTEAGIVFSKTGRKYVDLNVKLNNGTMYKDRKYITVRPTPYIEDFLVGIKKQNRAMTLTARVHAGKENFIKSVKITVENLTENEKIEKKYILKEGNKKHIVQGENTDHIKMRDLEISRIDMDGICKDYRFKFLSKPKKVGENKIANYRYKIVAEDMQGKIHEIEKYFDVLPDIPPVAKIEGNEKFYREKGGGEARVILKDASISKDGDQIISRWSMDKDFTGIENQSFGTNKMVALKKSKPGKAVITLEIKDKWEEETLKEYIKDIDVLSAKVQKNIEVDNKAPTVGIKPLRMSRKNFLIFAEDESEYERLLNYKNKFAEILEKHGLDAGVTVMRVFESPNKAPGSIKEFKGDTFDYGAEANGQIDESGMHLVDKRTIYMVSHTWKGKDYGFMPQAPVKIIAREPGTGKIRFTYIINGNEKFKLGQDNEDKYIYLIYKNRTILLDKNTGQKLGELPYKLGEKSYTTWKYIYTLDNNSLWQIDEKSGRRSLLERDITGIYPVKGTLQYGKLEGNKLIRGIIHKDTGKITRQNVSYTIINNNISNLTEDKLIFAGIDSEGKMIMFVGRKNIKYGKLFIVKPDNKSYMEIINGSNHNSNVCMALNESGRCNYISIASEIKLKGRLGNTVNVYDINKKRIASHRVEASSSYDGFPIRINKSAGFEIYGKPYFVYGGEFIYLRHLGVQKDRLAKQVSLDSKGNITFDRKPFSFIGDFYEYIKVAPGMIGILQGYNHPMSGNIYYQASSWFRTKETDKTQLKKEYLRHGNGISIDGKETLEILSEFAKMGEKSPKLKSLVSKLKSKENDIVENNEKIVFAKGEKVKFNIKYVDFENDKSKISFWKYEHLPKGEGRIAEHGKVLLKPIEKFDKKGKYILTHWQMDNCGVAQYDKSSNKEIITFYIEGEIKEPEVPVEEEMGIKGKVLHTEQWEKNRVKYNRNKFKGSFNYEINFEKYIKFKKPRIRYSNVFWSGEKLVLNAKVKGKPNKVYCYVVGESSILTELQKTGDFYIGSLWNKNMKGKWGVKKPELLKFKFIAEYKDGKKKESVAFVIMDSSRDYWDFHRLY